MTSAAEETRRLERLQLLLERGDAPVQSNCTKSNKRERDAPADGAEDRGGRNRKKRKGQFKNKERQQMAKQDRGAATRLQTVCLDLAFWNRCGEHTTERCGDGGETTSTTSPAPADGEIAATAAISSSSDRAKDAEREKGKNSACRRSHDVAGKLAEIERCGAMPYCLPPTPTEDETTNQAVAGPSEADAQGLKETTADGESDDLFAKVRLPTGEGSKLPCLVFRARGFCPAGVNCLWAGDHVDLKTGENLFDWNKIRGAAEADEGFVFADAESEPASKAALTRFIRERLHCATLQSGIAETNQLTDDIRNGLRRKRLAFPKSDTTIKLFSTLGAKKDSENAQGEAVAMADNDAAQLQHAAAGDPERELHQAAAAAEAVSGHRAASASTSGVGQIIIPDRLHDLPAVREQKRKMFCNKRILAPLTTVGNLPFRRLCVEQGCEVTVSEMALAESILAGNNSELAMLRRHSSEKHFGVQITSGAAAAMVKCAEFLDAHVDCDWVDINAACPLDQLHSKGCGSILTVRERALRQMVFGMRSVLSPEKLLTCKIRMSHYDNCSRYDALHILPKVYSWGADAAILHGRTARQRYTKLANWEYLKGCKQGLDGKMPLVGCGDVLSHTQYHKYLQEDYVDGVMIGRGALIKPWIFREIAEKRHIDLPATERLELIKKYCHYGLEHWGADERGRDTTRRFLLEWMSFYHRYLPIGLLEREYFGETQINWRPPRNCFGRDDLETLLMSGRCEDWIRISEMFLGKAGGAFSFVPKHKSASYKDPTEGASG
eukprot:g13118.t1